MFESRSECAICQAPGVCQTLALFTLVEHGTDLDVKILAPKLLFYAIIQMDSAGNRIRQQPWRHRRQIFGPVDILEYSQFPPLPAELADVQAGEFKYAVGTPRYSSKES